MPVHPIFNPEYLYFITTSAVDRKHVFQRDVIKRILVDSLHYLRISGAVKLYGFVIMPNHIHLMVRFLAGYKPGDVIREFKKHTSKQIIRQFRAEQNSSALLALENSSRQVGGKGFKVWEDGYDARDVFSVGFLQQKLDYIHNNPCQARWNLVENPEDYPWSSARFYVKNEPAIIAMDDVSEILV